MEIDCHLENTNGVKDMTVLRCEMLEYVSENKEVVFKSQQVGDPDLSKEEKRKIAEDVLDKSAASFLAKFGQILLSEHVLYFKNSTDSREKYEVDFHLKGIQKRLDNKTKAAIKNRRLEALKRLALEGEYFSECEMQKRNPLLYQHLVGQFLSRQEQYSNQRITETASLCNLILEKYDRDEMDKLLKVQIDEEDSVMEEEEDSDEDSEGDNIERNLWGEKSTDPTFIAKQKKPKEITDQEKRLLFEEFRSHMYSNFLQGKDDNFDYSKVDGNTDYDDLDTLNRDEEEKYFDSESPEEKLVAVIAEDEEEDPLDAYMSEVDHECDHLQISSRMNSLQT